MDQSLHIWIGGSGLGDGHWDVDIGILEILLLLVVDVRADAVDDGVLVPDHMGQISLASHVIQLHIGLISEIGSNLDLLELPVPEGSLSSIRVDNS